MTKTTENFYLRPADVLKSVQDMGPAAVAVVAMDDHGGISVFSSHSTPITLSMFQAAPKEIHALRSPK